MPESFDAYQYLNHLRLRWHVLATACAVAAVLSLIVSLLLPKQYTSMAQILILPPGSSDPRAATAVSPVYFDSLRTYEHFASSDSLFKKAVEELGVRKLDSRPLSKLKEAILEVEIPTNTKILEISVTLPDPQKAQELASFIAEKTVRLSLDANLESDRAQTAQIEQLRATALERAHRAERASLNLAENKAFEGLAEEVEALVAARSEVHQDILLAEVALSEASADAQNASTNPRQDATTQQARRSIEVRIERLRKQLAELDKQITAKRSMLATRSAQREAVESERASAWSALEAADQRLAYARATAAARSERLQVIDPGIVPERHSFPNLPLNGLVAFLLALVASVAYLSLEFSYQQRKAESMRRSLRVAGHG